MLLDLIHDFMVNVTEKERCKLFKHVTIIFLVNKTSHRLLYTFSFCCFSEFGFFMVYISIFKYLGFNNKLCVTVNKKVANVYGN